MGEPVDPTTPVVESVDPTTSILEPKGPPTLVTEPVDHTTPVVDPVDHTSPVLEQLSCRISRSYNSRYELHIVYLILSLLNQRVKLLLKKHFGNTV